MPDPKLAALIARFQNANGRDPDEEELRRMARAAGVVGPLAQLRSRVADVATQFGSGLAESALTSVGGISNLVGAKGVSNLTEQLREGLPQPTSRGGRVARIASRIGGDIGQFLIPGALVGKVAKAGTFLKSGGRIGSAFRVAATGAPVSAAIAAGDPEHSATSFIADITGSEALKDLASTSRGAALGDILIDGIPAVGALVILPGITRRLKTGGRPALDLWRASLTSQLSTATRNLVVGLARMPLALAEDVVATTAQRAFGANVSSNSSLKAVASMFGSLKPGRQKQAVQLLQDTDAITSILEKSTDLTERLLRTTASEVSATQTGVRQGLKDLFGSQGGNRLQGYINLIQTFNRTQETFVRKAAFSSAWLRRASKAGLDPSAIARDLERGATTFKQATSIGGAPIAQVQKLFEESVEEALEITFALTKKDFGPVGQKFLQFFQDYPAFLLVHPFPRFLANSTKFLWERSPHWLAKVGSKNFRKALFSGDRASVETIVKSSEGVLALAGGMALRAAHGGPKWYQLELPAEDESGNKRIIDMRPFAPISTAMYLGELIRAQLGEETQLTGQDALEAFAGIRRLSGTPLALLDFIEEARSPEEFASGANRYVQNLLGGLTTPAKTLRDLLSFFDEDEGVFRDREAEAELGPIKLPAVFSEMIANLPVIGKAALPAASTPTREGALGAEEPVGGIPTPALRQLTGLNVQTRTPLEEETQRLQLQPRTKTGVSSLDRFTDQFMGTAITNSNIDELLKSEDYVVLDDFNRRTQLSRVLTQVREQAKAIALQEHGEEIVQEIMQQLKGQPAAQQKQKLDGMQIPQAWKDQIFQMLREAAKPKSILGNPIAALADPQGPARDFVAAYLPQRAQNREQVA